MTSPDDSEIGISSAWREGICRANAIDVHYLRTGGDRAALIGLHGLMGSGHCLLPLARTLEPHFDVILPDARGHGKSTATADGYCYDELADDVIDFVDALGVMSPVLLGHSMGGLTAALIGSKLGQRLSAVVLVDPTFISPEWQQEVYDSDVVLEHQRCLSSSRKDLIDQARLKNPDRAIELIGHLAEARLNTDINALKILTPPNPDFRALVANISVPIHLLIGERGVVSLDTAEELHRLNPLLRYRVIAGAGHGVPYDQPEKLGTVILSALNV